MSKFSLYDIINYSNLELNGIKSAYYCYSNLRVFNDAKDNYLLKPLNKWEFRVEYIFPLK